MLKFKFGPYNAQQRLKRLQTLKQLAQANIPAEQFRMDRYVTKYDRKHNCGFICCLVGWLPALFPTVFAWTNVAGSYVIRALGGSQTFDFKRQVQTYFGISEAVFNCLFAGSALTDERGRDIIPAVRNMRAVTLPQALLRMDRVIALVERGAI